MTARARGKKTTTAKMPPTVNPKKKWVSEYYASDEVHDSEPLNLVVASRSSPILLTTPPPSPADYRLSRMGYEQSQPQHAQERVLLQQSLASRPSVSCYSPSVDQNSQSNYPPPVCMVSNTPSSPVQCHSQQRAMDQASPYRGQDFRLPYPVTSPCVTSVPYPETSMDLNADSYDLPERSETYHHPADRSDSYHHHPAERSESYHHHPIEESYHPRAAENHSQNGNFHLPVCSPSAVATLAQSMVHQQSAAPGKVKSKPISVVNANGGAIDSTDKKPYRPSNILPGTLCAVCNDPASGTHYNRITCEGCKGFFRRTVQTKKHQAFVCKNREPGSCPISSRTSRTGCQYCRFKKCLEIGMRQDMVKGPEERLELNKKKAMNRERKKMEAAKKAETELSQAIRPTLLHRTISHHAAHAFTVLRKYQTKQDQYVKAGEIRDKCQGKWLNMLSTDLTACAAFCLSFHESCLKMQTSSCGFTSSNQEMYDHLNESILSVLFLVIAHTYRSEDRSLCFGGMRITPDVARQVDASAAEQEDTPKDSFLYMYTCFLGDLDKPSTAVQRCAEMTDTDELAMHLLLHYLHRDHFGTDTYGFGTDEAKERHKTVCNAIEEILFFIHRSKKAEGRVPNTLLMYGPAAADQCTTGLNMFWACVGAEKSKSAIEQIHKDLKKEGTYVSAVDIEDEEMMDSDS